MSDIRTRFRGDYINNLDLQRHLLKESVNAERIGKSEVSDYLAKLAERIDELRE